MRKLYCHKNCSKLDNGQIIELKFLTIGKFYYGDLVPRLLDPVTYKPLKDSYIITCDDYKDRRIDIDFFMSISEYRNKRIEELGI